MLTPLVALDLARHFEGCRLTRYRDAVGVWTIGWGHVCAADQEPITQAQADAWLVEDMERAIAGVIRLLPGVGSNYLTPGRLAALGDFYFNLGVTRFKSSTLRRKVLDYDDQGAADEFPKWRLPLINGKPLRGITLRRAAERDLWLAA